MSFFCLGIKFTQFMFFLKLVVLFFFGGEKNYY